MRALQSSRTTGQGSFVSKYVLINNLEININGTWTFLIPKCSLYLLPPPAPVGFVSRCNHSSISWWDKSSD